MAANAAVGELFLCEARNRRIGKAMELLFHVIALQG
jgi:hypothetical protein